MGVAYKMISHWQKMLQLVYRKRYNCAVKYNRETEKHSASTQYVLGNSLCMYSRYIFLHLVLCKLKVLYKFWVYAYLVNLVHTFWKVIMQPKNITCRYILYAWASTFTFYYRLTKSDKKCMVFLGEDENTVKWQLLACSGYWMNEMYENVFLGTQNWKCIKPKLIIFS